MKTIVAGSRSITSYPAVALAILRSNFKITEVVSGRARGVDRLGEQWARCNSVPCKSFPADWGTLGVQAGQVRNIAMAEYADALVAIWDGHSKGTMHMLETARRKRLHLYIHLVTKDIFTSY